MRWTWLFSVVMSLACVLPSPALFRGRFFRGGGCGYSAPCYSAPAYSAPSCAPVYQAPYYPPVVKEVVKEEVVVPVIAPVYVYTPYPVQVPAYSASYVPTSPCPCPPGAPAGAYGRGGAPGGASAVPSPAAGAGGATAYPTPAGPGATSGPGPAAPPASATPPAPTPGAGQGNDFAVLLEVLTKMNDRMSRIEERLAVLEMMRPPPEGTPPPREGGGRGEPPPGAAAGTPPARSPGAAVLTAKCFACHSQGHEADGGKFAFLDKAGATLDVGPAGWAKVARQVERDKMPPKDNKYGLKPLTPEEKKLVLEHLKSLGVPVGGTTDEETPAAARRAGPVARGGR